MRLSETIEELRSLNEPVTHPLRLPTEAEVDAAEERLGIKFPADYRRYLLEASDVIVGTLEPAIVTGDAGHLALVETARLAWDELDVPRDLLPICEDNGDFYCLNASGEVV
ncbi:MAG TPA: SMI1/KNR4 family protein, partial [Longimicrobium sp.]|nr:SMI1/KNR4 family protein [Longimicrobium sp.]